MKQIFLLTIVILFAYSCKKNHPATPAFFNCPYSTPTAAAIIHSQQSYSLCECIYHPNSPSDGYLFKFMDSVLINDGVQMVITGDGSGKLVTNQTFTYKYSQSNLPNLSAECLLYVQTYNVSVAGLDSAEVTINFSRYSGGTLDGTFSETIWQSTGDSASVTNGFFNNVPVKNQ